MKIFIFFLGINYSQACNLDELLNARITDEVIQQACAYYEIPSILCCKIIQLYDSHPGKIRQQDASTPLGKPSTLLLVSAMLYLPLTADENDLKLHFRQIYTVLKSSFLFLLENKMFDISTIGSLAMLGLPILYYLGDFENNSKNLDDMIAKMSSKDKLISAANIRDVLEKITPLNPTDTIKTGMKKLFIQFVSIDAPANEDE